MDKDPISHSLHSEAMEKLRKAGSDATRLRIYDLLNRRSEWTAKELSRELGVNPNSLYYHLRIMEDAGLISVVRTQVAGRMAERVYAATDPKRVTWDKKDPLQLSAYLAATLEAGKVCAEDAIYEMARDLEVDENDKHNTIVYWGAPSIGTTPDEVREFHQRLQGLLKEFRERAKDKAGEEVDRGEGPRLRFFYALHSQKPLQSEAGSAHPEPASA